MSEKIAVRSGWQSPVAGGLSALAAAVALFIVDEGASIRDGTYYNNIFPGYVALALSCAISAVLYLWTRNSVSLALTFVIFCTFLFHTLTVAVVSGS